MAGRSLLSPEDVQLEQGQGRSLLDARDLREEEDVLRPSVTIPEKSILESADPNKPIIPTVPSLLSRDDIEPFKRPRSFAGRVQEAMDSGNPADLIKMHIEQVSEAVGKFDAFLADLQKKMPAGPVGGASAIQGIRGLIGLAETAGNFLSFIPAGFASTLAAAARAKEDGLQSFPDTFNTLLESLTYHPKSEAGSAVIDGVVAPVMDWLLNTMPESASEWARESVGSEELALALRVGIPAVVLTGPMVVGRGAVRRRQDSLGEKKEPTLEGEPTRVREPEFSTEGQIDPNRPGRVEPTLDEALNKAGEEIGFAERATMETAGQKSTQPRVDVPDSILSDQVRDAIQAETTTVRLGENLQRYLEQAGPEAAAMAPEIAELAAKVVESGRVRKVSVFGSTLRLGKGMNDVDIMFDLDLRPSRLGKDPERTITRFIEQTPELPGHFGAIDIKGRPVQPFFRVGNRVFVALEGDGIREIGAHFAEPPKIRHRPLSKDEASLLRKADPEGFAANRAVFEIIKSMSSKDVFKELREAAKKDAELSKKLIEGMKERVEKFGFRLGKRAEDGQIITDGPNFRPDVIFWKEHKGRTVTIPFDPKTGRFENPGRAMALIEERIAFSDVSIQALAAQRARGGKRTARERPQAQPQAQPEPPPKAVETPPAEEVTIAEVGTDALNPVGVSRADLIRKNVLPADATFSELQRSLFEVRKKTDEGGRTRRMIRPRHEDIGPFTRFFTGRVVPPRKIARLHNDHPLLKWVADRLSATNRKIEVMADEFLWGTEFGPGKLPFGTARRFFTPQRTNRGGLTQFWRMKTEKQAKVTEAMVRWDREGIEPTREMMEAKGFDPEMIAATESLYKLFERVREYVNSKVGAEVIKKRPGFIPHIFQGDFAVFVNNAKGELVAAPRTNSKRAAKRMLAEAKKQFEPLGYTVNMRPIRTRHGIDIDAVQEVSRLIRGTEEGARIEKRLEQIVMEESFQRFFQERKGVLGYMGTEGGKQGARAFLKAVQAYTEGAIRYGEMLGVTKEVGRALVNKRIGLWYPNAQRVSTWMFEQAIGKASAIEKATQAFAVEMLKRGESFFTDRIDFVNDLTRIMKLYGGNIRYLLANGLQPWLVTPAKLMHLKAAKNLRGSVIKANALASKDFFFPSDEAKAALLEAFKWRTIDPKFLSTDSLFHQAEILGGRPLVVIDILSGRRLAGRVEEYARMMAFLQFYHFLRDAKVPFKEAVEGARYLTDDYMVLYTGTDRPVLFHQLGTIGKSVAVFKTFQFDYLAQQVEYIKTAKQAPSALATFVGAQVFMGGLLGIIAIEQADYLLHKLGYPTLTQILLESGLPEWALWGPPSAALDIDLTTTTAAPGLGVQDLISAPGLEYVGKAVIDGLDYGIKKARGVATPADEMRFLQSIAPTSMQGMIEKYYSRDELVIVPKRGGVGQFRREPKDWIKRYMSGRSLREARIIKGLWAATQMERNRAYDIDALADLGAWHMAKYGDIPDFVFDKALEDFEVRPRDMWQRIRTRFENLSESMLEQFTRLERTAAGRRRAEMLRAMGIDPDDVRQPVEVPEPIEP